MLHRFSRACFPVEAGRGWVLISAKVLLVTLSNKTIKVLRRSLEVRENKVKLKRF